MNKRIQWVDVGKYICIMCVMLSHLESGTQVLRNIYSPFFLTMFFFLAGYVYKKPNTFKEFVIKKVKGLIVPWFVLSTFDLVLSSIISFKANRNLLQEVLWNLAQIRPLGDVMWFVPALFMAFIPFYFVSQIKNKKYMLGLSFALAFCSNIYSFVMPKDIYPWGNNALPWHIEYMFYAMFWMMLGYWYKNDFEKKSEKCNSWLFGISSLFIYLIMALFINIPNGLCRIIWNYLISIVGLTVVVFIAKKIKANKYISFVGANTIIYFGLHGKVYAVLEHILSTKFGNFYSFCLNNDLYSSILAIILTFIMSIVLTVPAEIINRWFPWIVGRKKNI